MGIGASQRRLLAIFAAAAAAALLLAGVFRAPPPSSKPKEPEPVRSEAVQNSTATPEARPAVFVPPPASSGEESGDTPAGPSALDRAAYPVDLERLREKLPGNIYFRLGAPTEDTETLRARAEEERRWNELFGKVQSNTATEDEIQRYYDHRRALSEDYIKFAELVLEDYGDKLPEQDRGLYELAIKMHRGRLAEIPKQIEDALARRDAHEALREKWRKGGEGSSQSP